MMTMDNIILVKHGLISIPKKGIGLNNEPSLNKQILGTLISNLVYYGYSLSKEALDNLVHLNDDEAKEWWTNIEPVLKEVTGDNKNMAEYVVYKNFPQECLDMSQSEYWIKQIFMYLGFPNEYFTEPVKPRSKMVESLQLKILHLSDDDSLKNILKNLLLIPTRWTPEQFNWVTYLILDKNYPFILKEIPYKENFVNLVKKCIERNYYISSFSSATDVLRLATVLSGGELSNRNDHVYFKSFSRPIRKYILKQLENCKNLEDDVSRDKERWKKFLKGLHPGDYNFPKVSEVYNKLYNNNTISFNHVVEKYISEHNECVLSYLKNRPGEFVRRLHHLITIYSDKAIENFCQIVPDLKTIQLLKIKKYLSTINDRKKLIIPPNGNWVKLQIIPNNKTPIKDYQISNIIDYIDKELAFRLRSKSLLKVYLSEDTKKIKLPTNDSDILPYGRGTVFPIPNNIKFIRSASYWKKKDPRNIWYDNGWNFFNSEWKHVGACCWDFNRFLNNSAIFSGDPTSCKDPEGNACQMIDLYIDKLVESGKVRYAVWNILCYSETDFNSAEVYGALQFGEEAQKGNLFEPSRCKFMFKIGGKYLNKYVAYIDLVKRELVYIDVSFPSRTKSASRNGKKLSELMPAYVEYLNALPSVYDLFSVISVNNIVDSNMNKSTPILYSDENFQISDNRLAYVFNPSNEKNNFKQLLISDYL